MNFSVLPNNKEDNKRKERKLDKISKFQLQVYYLCSQIPNGYITTYKFLANALKTSPRAIGKALRKNPFCPSPVPCHRVIANNLYLGGYKGQWGKGENPTRKKNLLKREGIFFNKNNYLLKELENKVIKYFEIHLIRN